MLDKNQTSNVWTVRHFLPELKKYCSVWSHYIKYKGTKALFANACLVLYRLVQQSDNYMYKADSILGHSERQLMN